MTPSQFQAALHQLGLTHRGAASFLGYQERHIRRLVAGKCPIPPYIAKLFAIMLAKRLTPKKVDRLLTLTEASLELPQQPGDPPPPNDSGDQH